jgi:hypothetical protein
VQKTPSKVVVIPALQELDDELEDDLEEVVELDEDAVEVVFVSPEVCEEELLSSSSCFSSSSSWPMASSVPLRIRISSMGGGLIFTLLTRFSATLVAQLTSVAASLMTPIMSERMFSLFSRRLLLEGF